MEAKPVRLVKFTTEEGFGPFTVDNFDTPFKYDLKGWNIIPKPEHVKKRHLIVSCNRGFHASTFGGVTTWLREYSSHKLRAFIVEVSGLIDVNTLTSQYNKVCAEKMKFIYEIDIKGLSGRILLDVIHEKAIKFEVFNKCDIYEKNPYFKKYKENKKFRTRV